MPKEDLNMEEERNEEQTFLMGDDSLVEIESQFKFNDDQYKIGRWKMLRVPFLIGVSFCLGLTSSFYLGKAKEWHSYKFLYKHDLFYGRSSNIHLLSLDESARAGSRVKFIPFPHRSLGSGKDASCTWSTNTTCNPDHDIIQRAIFKDGLCLPKNMNLHIFSTAEAIECLSPIVQKKNIEVVIAGDSYNRQLFIGLADILLGRPSNDEIRTGDSRDVRVQEDNYTLVSLSNGIPSFPRVMFVCKSECYGEMPNTTNLCSECLNEYTKANNDSVAVLGTFVHSFNRLRNVEKNFTRYMLDFLNKTHRVIYNSIPSYSVNKIPLKYRSNPHPDAGTKVYMEILSQVGPKNKDQPFIDFFQLTSTCVMNNCSIDGGHKARFVNRWKAQLLLNTICDVELEEID